ncbi:MAG TPA: ester cyclase [Terracidiphilus sp.]|nr:ester cyclase [Terracidiphilus sp.]
MSIRGAFDLRYKQRGHKGTIMSAANKEVIRTFIEDVINQNRLDRADDLVQEDFVELDPLPGQQQGREGLKGILASMRTAFPDIHWTIHEMVSEGDKVVSRFHWTGTHRAPFVGIPATGKSVLVHGVVIDRLEQGRMADSRILMDTLSLMQQLGVIPAPAAAG